MYLRTISMTALICAVANPSQSNAAPAAPPSASNPGVCGKLSADYDQIEKSLALTFAQGVAEDSASRETNRQIESSNYLTRADMTLTLMQAHHCNMPDHAPSIARYISPALKCAVDRGSATDPESCKMENWQPSK